MTPAAFETLVRTQAADLGLIVNSVTSKPNELGHGLANTDIRVRCDNATVVYCLMTQLNRRLNIALGREVRLGYYDALIGYNVPKGEAMIEADLHSLEF